MNKGIGAWLTYHSEQIPEQAALIYKDKTITYKELNIRVNKLANSLLKLGVRFGDRVNALLFNSNECMETMFACAKIGAIFVPINFRLSIDEIEYIVRDSGTGHLIYDERMAQAVNALRERIKELNYFIHVGHSPDLVDLSYENLIDQSLGNEPQFELSENDVHMMMYTSGTTGKPKGAMLTHGNTQWNAINAIQFLAFKENDITLTVAPLFHIGGMNILTTPVLYKGGTVVLQDHFQPDKVLHAIQTYKVTSLFLVPAMWMALLHSNLINDYDLSSFRFCISGGAPCPLTVIEFFQQKQVPLYEGFGLTETAPFVSLLDAKNAYRKMGSVGKNPIHTEVKIVNDLGSSVEHGEVGELLVKGPNVFAGYWNKPLETKKAIKDSWFYTGDLARMDDEGFIYIVDRKKDMIISGGENIYPAEVEQVLYKHPDIKEVAVVGAVDETWGEVPKAYIVLHDTDNNLTLQHFTKFCNGKLANYKIPKHIELLSNLPRNATGKVLKTQLRNML
ncbi:o-succinylbenzoate--CoA ligase [Cytobacillus sp. Hm23]